MSTPCVLSSSTSKFPSSRTALGNSFTSASRLRSTFSPCSCGTDVAAAMSATFCWKASITCSITGVATGYSCFSRSSRQASPSAFLSALETR